MSHMTRLYTQAKMGDDDDVNAVLDPLLRVRGVATLRVVDTRSPFFFFWKPGHAFRGATRQKIVGHELANSLKSQLTTGWRRVMGCCIFIGHFPQKSPIIGELFCEK